MGLVETLDSALVCGMQISPGKVLLGLVMNVLCGRSPLYRVEEFFRMRDVEMLLGEGIRADQLGDDTLGRVHAYGTWKIFSEVCIQNFGVNCEVVHHDTTSISVWGEYRPSEKDPFHTRHGFSKDKRPDLKQFIISLLCAEGNLPCHAAMLRTRKPMGRSSEIFHGSWPGMGCQLRISSMLQILLWPPKRTSLSCMTVSASSPGCRKTLAHAGNS